METGPPGQLFAKLLAVPRVATFVDQTLAEGQTGTLHDGAWIVELSLDPGPIGCILDGTVRVEAGHARWLEALAFRLPAVPTIAVAARSRDGAPPTLDQWMTRWPDPQEIAAGYPTVDIAYVDDPHDPDNLTRLAAHDLLRDARSILLIGGRSPLIVPQAIDALHARLPELRPIVLTADPLEEDLIDALARAGGAYLLLSGRTVASPRSEVAWTGVTIELDAGRDVEISGPRRIERIQPLRATDTLRIDAISTHIDEPAFTAHARGQRTDLPLAFGALQVARRQTAPPTPAHVAAAVEASRIALPSCEPAETTLPRDLWVDGAIALDLGNQIHRVRLLPAMRIESPTAAVDLRVVRGKVYVRPRAGDILIDGIRPTGEHPLAPYKVLTLDDVRISIAIAAAWPDEQPELVIERGVERYPMICIVDGVPVELRRHGRTDELWCRGAPLSLFGTLAPRESPTFDHVEDEVADLSWLLHAARSVTITGRSGEPIAIEHPTVSAELVIDLPATSATIRVRHR